MARQTLDRREFLKGAGSLGVVSLALPMLPSLGYAEDGADFPRRLVVFASANGTIAPQWIPQSVDGQITQLSPILQPLAPHLDDLFVLEGLDITVGKKEYQPGVFHSHERGYGGILTGQPLNLGEMEAGSGYANGISVDQYIANRLAGATRIHSFQVGLVTRRHPRGHYNRDTMTYAGPDKPLFAQSNGGKLFDHLFGGANSTSDYKHIQARRKSVLDYLKDDIRRVESMISVADRLRLEQHHQAFRDLEQRIAEPPSSFVKADSSVVHSYPHTIENWFDEDNMDAISDFQIKQTVQALASNRTQVATIQFGAALAQLSMRFVGSGEDWHEMSHEGDDNEVAQEQLVAANTYAAGCFAQLLGEMKSVPEGDGTLLDHSIVLWVNELGKGNSHTYNDVPIVMAGSLHDTFKTGGAHVKLGERTNNDLLITLCHAFGYNDVTTFGLPELCTGPISELCV